MKIYRDESSLFSFGNLTPDVELAALVQKRLLDAKSIEGIEISDLLNIIVVDEGDTVEEIEHQLGFTVLHNRWNGCSHTSKSFTPSWDALDAHVYWYELIFVISDDGFGFIVFLPRSNSDELITLCDKYANEIYTA